jgi:hypothetical protein
MVPSARRVSVLCGVFGLLAACGVTGADGTKDAEPVRPSAVTGREGPRAPRVGEVPPELQATKGDWLAGPPTALAAPRGKVVWLQFNF